MLEVTLPLPPSLNHQYHRLHGRVVLTGQARTYRDEAAWLVRAAADRQPGVASRLRVIVRFRFGDRRRRDLDNPLKLLLDAVCTGLGVDDSQIDELHVYRGYDLTSPGVMVRVLWDMPPAPADGATSGVCGLHRARLMRDVVRA